MRRQRRPALDGGLSQRHDRVVGVLVLASETSGDLDDRLRVDLGDPEDDDGARVDLAAGADGGDAVDLGDEDRDRPYQAGRSKHWVKIKNRKHPAMQRVMESFA